jgi:2-C-methyl-D-erythritol 4-phosphate cytidylyltransferase
MGAGVPKQYLPLAGCTVIEHTLERLRAHPRVSAVVVAIAADDDRFARLPVAASVRVARGGVQRADSVLGALESLTGEAGPGDWALVHDAVRPCLHADDLDRLIADALAHDEGALLASPVRDTMKRVAHARVEQTVPREGLWHALTPQLFPLGALREALLAARRDGVAITDEAQAMERVGQPPRVVHGRADNIKITRAEDLQLAAFYLTRMERTQ